MLLISTHYNTFSTLSNVQRIFYQSNRCPPHKAWIVSDLYTKFGDHETTHGSVVLCNEL